MAINTQSNPALSGNINPMTLPTGNQPAQPQQPGLTSGSQIAKNPTTPKKTVIVATSKQAKTNAQNQTNSFNQLNQSVNNHAQAKAGAQPNVSIVDLLVSKGQSSDYGSRSKLAAQAGIKNYAGTAAQNAQLISYVNGQTGTAQKTTTTTPDGTKQTTQPTAQSQQGAQQGTQTQPIMTPIDPKASYEDQVNSGLNDQMHAYESTQAKLDQIMNGTFPLTRYQKGQIDAVKEQFDELKQLQVQANNNNLALQKQAMFRTGEQNTDPGQFGAQINQQVSQGIQKIMSIDTQASKVMNELKQSFLDKDYQMINDQYTKLSSLLKSKSETIDKIQKHADDIRDFNQRVKEHNDSMAIQRANLNLSLAKSGYKYENGKIVPNEAATVVGTNPRSLIASLFQNKSLKKTQDIDNAAAVVSAVQEISGAHKGGLFEGFGLFAGGYKPKILSSQEATKTRSQIDALEGKVQQWLSGASLSKPQEKLVRSFIPNRYDSDETIKTKMNSLTNYMMSDIAGRVSTQGVDFKYQPVDFWNGTNISPDSVGSKVTQAINSGYDQSEVIDYMIQSEPDLADKIQSARDQGISDDEIVSFLAQQQ